MCFGMFITFSMKWVIALYFSSISLQCKHVDAGVVVVPTFS